jgi:hypothetical protein
MSDMHQMKLFLRVSFLLFLTLVTACSENDNASQENKAISPVVSDAVLVEAPIIKASTESDLEREARLAEQIVDAIFDGEPVWLDTGKHKFLGVSMETQTDANSRGVLIIHGRGYHPDWEQVVRPLRIGLTEHGWNTLSLQMPVLEKEATYYEYIPIFPEAFPRIEAGIKYLKAQGNDTVVVIAHSCGVHMAMEWVRNRDISGMDGFIGIGMGATDYQQTMKEPFPFKKITVPVMDIYGAMDYPAVQHGAEDRLAAMQAAGNAKSKQVILEDADHYMHEQDEILIETVVGWLDSVFTD